MKTSTLFILSLLCITFFASAAKARVYDYTYGNKIELLEDPNEAIKYKFELIKNAKKHIHIITFYWDDSSFPKNLAKALSEANARGVEVRILSSFIPTLGTDFIAAGRRDLVARSEATMSYLDLTPGKRFSATHNLHEKVFLVDGEVAIIGGRNISDSSLKGKDLEISLEGPVVNQVQEHFRELYDFLADLEIKKDCLKKHKSQKKQELCTRKIEKTRFAKDDQNFFPAQEKFAEGVKARLLSHDAIINHYKHGYDRKERLDQPDDILDTVTNIEFETMRTYVYFMTLSDRFNDYLLKNLNQGKTIKLITNSLESGKFSSNKGYLYSIPTSLNLVEEGLEMYQWQRNQMLNYVHEKLIIFDDERMIIGSHNFGTGSTSVSNEIAIDFYSKEIAERLIQVFEEETSNPNVTFKSDEKYLQEEYNENKKAVKVLRNNALGKLIREIY